MLTDGSDTLKTVIPLPFGGVIVKNWASLTSRGDDEYSIGITPLTFIPLYKY